MQTICYDNYQNLIHDLAWKYCGLLKTDQEELFAEGNLVFCSILDEWDESKSKFSTFLHNCITNRFKDMLKEKRDLLMSSKYSPEGSNELTPECIADFWSTIGSLSSESQEVVDLVLSGPRDMVRIGTIKSHLREAGWAWRTIWESVEEIKSVFH